MTDEIGTTPSEAHHADLGDDGLLMRLHDGELDGELLESAEALRDGDSNASDKLASMELVGALLRENVAADTRADSIAGSVMAQIAAGAHESLDDEVGDAVPIGSMPEVRLGSKPAANDNARAIFAAAGLAAAVAFGMFFWGGQQSSSPLAEGPAVTPPSTGVEVALKDPTPRPSSDEVKSEFQEHEPTVEVASVDFGSKSGSVFYVPSGDPGDATTVVWVSDLEEEEEL